MMQRFLFLSKTSCAVLVLMFLLQAGMSPAFARQDCVEVNWEQLDLSPQQRNALNTLDEHWHNRVGEIVPRIEANQRRLKRLMQMSGSNEEQIMRLQQQVHRDKSQLKMEATQIYLSKRKVLNDHQQQKLQQMISSSRNKK